MCSQSNKAKKKKKADESPHAFWRELCKDAVASMAAKEYEKQLHCGGATEMSGLYLRKRV